ncbi:hypothetical protein [Microcoleus sp. PH2017_39_LGB_O_B]|uniref:hypothetical protein n=1 Tax=Microcoleus sp. PH2017_39_LGB_O_B TaxID=2798849 RepID=UPI0025DDAC08|nr:hypothetical protein [Microcoleus sp. PH2017_39_LGB_O_B]TAF85540.1 MAG: hypothetical protein EAZ49_26205 [Oscillatoriales cyanobacterium]
MNESNQTTILISASAAGVISTQKSELIGALASQPGVIDIAKTFANSKLIRELRLTRNLNTKKLQKLDFQKNRVIYQGQEIGKTQILYKSPLPGELQARLSIESAIDRFLEYLQKQYQIAVLHESDYHVHVFIPHRKEPADFNQYWREFIENIAFSTYGIPKHNLPGLVQTFIVMLNSVTLAGRGFSTLEIPILTQQQSNVLAAWYLAVIREVEKRQTDRQKQIKALITEINHPDTSDKDRTSLEKKLLDKEEMQLKEAKKYNEAFQKSFGKVLDEQKCIWQNLTQINSELADSGLTKAQKNKLQKQQDKLVTQIIFTQDSVQQKIRLFAESEGEPFKFIQCDRQQNPARFKDIVNISKSFTKTATDQINATRGDIFTQCILEMYRLLENPPSDPFPEPLLSEQPSIKEVRSAGDDGKHFCYSCGVTLQNAKWEVARFMFERPSQRCQSSSREKQPYICASCSALAFASPLKVTDESIILKLEPVDRSEPAKLKVKDYIRMLTNKELHLSAGRYIVLASDRTGGGDLASQKLGQVQYALAKVASIFPLEVLADFKFSLIIQGSQSILLSSRHLIFIKGLIEGYGQSIIVLGKDINMKLGDAVRYVEDDLPVMAEYTLAKISEVSGSDYSRGLEHTRAAYWKKICEGLNLKLKGGLMESDNPMLQQANLYGDVAALTGLIYAFVLAFKKNAMTMEKPEDAKREVSKLIEQIEKNPAAFCYSFCKYCTIVTIGSDQAIESDKRTLTQVRLYRNPDTQFVYEQAKALLAKEELLGQLGISEREKENPETKSVSMILYPEDLTRVYTYFSNPKNGYKQEKDWKDLTYQVKLSLYTRFPELIRKEKSTTEK